MGHVLWERHQSICLLSTLQVHLGKLGETDSPTGYRRRAARQGQGGLGGDLAAIRSLETQEGCRLTVIWTDTGGCSGATS
jgi:hypothetical protein